MPHLKLTAKSVGIEPAELVPLREISKRVRRGEIIIVSECMQATGYFEQIKAASLEAIRQIVGENKAARVREEGFEAIHKIIDLEKLTSILNCSYEIFYSLAPVLSKTIVKEVFQTEKPFYFEADPNVRFHIPYDIAVKRKEELCSFYWSGKITAHCPHHDSWYDCPTNSINVWIAVGSVKIGNGLSIYPQVYGKRLPCTKDGMILRNQYFGRALNFELQPGDALIFHGEHLHSSEINITDETRHVVSLRLTLEKPAFLNSSPYKFIYSYFGLVGKLTAKFERFQAKVAQRAIKLINSSGIRRETCDRVSQFDDTSSDFPQLLQSEIAGTPPRTQLLFDCSKLEIGTIRPVSEMFCAARLDEQRIAVFSRRCPHQGADLAAGYVRDGCVVCPWHNLPFSMESGASPCKAIPPLTVFDYLEKSNKDEWQTSLC